MIGSSPLRITPSPTFTTSHHQAADLDEEELLKKILADTGEDDEILMMADGYAKEEFGIVDEDALDSIAEFTNCVNGLYAAELSFQNISMDMMPPKLSFDEAIDASGEYYSLPVFLEGKKCNLIVQFD